MEKRSVAHLLCVSLLAAGCVATPRQPDMPSRQQAHHIALRLEQVGYPQFPLARPGGTLPAELERPMSWHWRGPYTDAVAILARVAGYSTLIPDGPASSPLITVELDHVTLGELIDEVRAAGSEFASLKTDIPNHQLQVVWR